MKHNLHMLYHLSPLVLLPLILIGCGENPPKPVVEIRTVEVKVPVPVPCKMTKIEKPVMPVDSLKKEQDLFTKVKTALAELELRQAYELKLEAAAEGCQ